MLSIHCSFDLSVIATIFGCILILCSCFPSLGVTVTSKWPWRRAKLYKKLMWNEVLKRRKSIHCSHQLCFLLFVFPLFVVNSSIPPISVLAQFSVSQRTFMTELHTVSFLDNWMQACLRKLRKSLCIGKYLWKWRYMQNHKINFRSAEVC